MEFRRPFDPDQRAAAARIYRSYRKHLKHVRTAYPPVTAMEESLFWIHQDLVQQFGREAAQLDVKVNVRRLNKLRAQVEEAAIDYVNHYRVRVIYGTDREPD